MSKVKKVFKTFFVILLILILAYIGLTLWVNRDNLPFSGTTEETQTISTEFIEAEVLNISEYATLSYQYSNISKFDDIREFYGLKLPFTNKSFIIKYDGEMKLGIDGSKAQVEIADNIISIHLPAPKVLSHVIYEDSIEVFDQTHNIFNQVEIEDYSEFAVEQKKVMEKRADAEGVFQNAQSAAEEQIAGFIKSILGESDDYQVVVDTSSVQVSETDSKDGAPNTQE